MVRQRDTAGQDRRDHEQALLDAADDDVAAVEIRVVAPRPIELGVVVRGPNVERADGDRRGAAVLDDVAEIDDLQT